MAHERTERTVAAYLSEVTDGYDLYRSARTKQRYSMAPASPALKRVNKDTKPGVDAKQSVIFPLGPREHEWLVKCAAGQQDQICQLLLQDIKLAEKRNFISGFTVLHWAAKQGNTEMVRKIFLLSQQGGSGVDVNTKSYDGYTPLHLAAIHSHESVLSVLVRDYGANCNIRDNSGKKPYHYLHKDASPKEKRKERKEGPEMAQPPPYVAGNKTTHEPTAPTPPPQPTVDQYPVMKIEAGEVYVSEPPKPLLVETHQSEDHQHRRSPSSSTTRTMTSTGSSESSEEVALHPFQTRVERERTE
ncbi:hypothetical protein P4O66_004754 [Electrophorus voltai]|uniref:Sosondowah ankyrin repeat domain family member Aa n=1 Tax=Electrophorus voltai TaxID=2609070 RepID=A0AAD8YPT3_9TELE|nr:hypothetical protein P4O66_004754 [Electrophorus voltai]